MIFKINNFYKEKGLNGFLLIKQVLERKKLYINFEIKIKNIY